MASKRLLIYSGHGEIAAGDARYIIDLISFLSAQHYDLRVWSDAGTPFAQRLQEWLRVGIRPVEYLRTFPPIGRESQAFRLASVRGSTRFLYSWLSLRYLRAKLENAWILLPKLWHARRQADIFWVNNGGYPGKEAGLVAVVLARMLRFKRIVMTIHNVPPARRWFRPSDFFYDRLVPAACDLIVVPSQNVRHDLVERRGFPPSKLRVIYCGLEDSETPAAALVQECRIALGATPQDRVILMTGSLDERRKGHEVLIDAIGRLPLAIRDRLKVWVVGGGSLQRVAELETRIRILGLEQKIRLLGHRTDIALLNHASDLAVVPSLAQEATPYTLKEAARAGRPVVTTRAGGCPEGVIEGETGLLTEPGNADQLATAMQQLLESDRKRLQMGVGARQLFIHRFLLAARAQEHLEVLDGY